VGAGYNSGELRLEADHFGLRTFNNLMRPSTAGNDSILRHRYSLPDSEPSPCKVSMSQLRAGATHRLVAALPTWQVPCSRTISFGCLVEPQPP
jgi:hypothetical protein